MNYLTSKAFEVPSLDQYLDQLDSEIRENLSGVSEITSMTAGLSEFDLMSKSDCEEFRRGWNIAASENGRRYNDFDHKQRHEMLSDFEDGYMRFCEIELFNNGAE